MAADTELDLDPDESLAISLEAYEGPLHVLLALARTQKVDLREISVLTLARQYLAFVEAAREARLEVTSDYLVMAAWLAYLKSRLIVPESDTDDDAEPLTAEDMARALAFRLVRLDAMRAAADRLFERDQLGRDVHVRGAPEGLRSRTTPDYTDTLVDLLRAYGRRRGAVARARVRLPAPRVYALEDARKRLERLLSQQDEWRQLDLFLPQPDIFGDAPPPAASVTASAFAAGLELARDGRAELRQDRPFGPLYLRAGAQSGA